MLDNHKYMIFTLEQKIKHLEYLRDVEKKSFMRRVQAEVADKNYDLVFQVDALARKNSELGVKIDNFKQAAKEEVKREYEELVRNLSKEIMIMRGKFASYKKQLYKEIDEKFSVVKNEAMMNMKSQENYSTALKKRALKIVIDDNEKSDLKLDIQKRKAREIKLMIFYKLKLMALHGKYEKRIKDMEVDKEKMKEQYYADKHQTEERLNLLRQELMKTQQTLSSAEMESEQLRKDLQLQIKNKQKLVSWKVKNAQLLEQLEEKVEKFERWNQFDVDKLLLELEKKRKDVNHFEEMEKKIDRKAELAEHKNNKKLDLLKRKLKKEQKMKVQLSEKLATARADVDVSQDAGIWQKKYFDAMAELSMALREADLLKTQLDKMGVDVHSTLSDADVLSMTSPATTATRPMSGKSTMRSVNMNAVSSSSTTNNQHYSSVVKNSQPIIPQLQLSHNTTASLLEDSRLEYKPPYAASRLQTPSIDSPSMRASLASSTGRPASLIPTYRSAKTTNRDKSGLASSINISILSQSQPISARRSFSAGAVRHLGPKVISPVNSSSSGGVAGLK